jgi:hypothetical protein
MIVMLDEKKRKEGEGKGKTKAKRLNLLPAHCPSCIPRRADALNDIIPIPHVFLVCENATRGQFYELRAVPHQ